MDAHYPLSNVLISSLLPMAVLHRLAPSSQLELRLTNICQGARATWPTVFVADETFLQYLAKKAEEPQLTDPANVLADLHTTDLYICCGCLLKLPAAVAALNGLIVPSLPMQLARMNLSVSDLDEVAQLLRQHLLLSKDSTPAKIQSYDGRSTLTTWLRTVASRIALDYLRQRQPPYKDLQDDDVPALGRAMVTTLEPELQYIEARYRTDVQQALYDAFSVLAADQRRLLREYFIDRQTTVQLAARYQVHNANIGRRIQKALKAVRHETERLLKERLGAEANILESLIELVRSQLHLSAERVLSESGSPQEEHAPQ